MKRKNQNKFYRPRVVTLIIVFRYVYQMFRQIILLKHMLTTNQYDAWNYFLINNVLTTHLRKIFILRIFKLWTLGKIMQKTVTFPANTSTLNRCWNNLDRQRSSTLFQRWYLVVDESWADVHLSTLFQHWQNHVETTLIELRQFNVDEPTLIQHWNLVENESWANVCLSTLFQRWQNNVETTLIELRWFNVDDPMLFQRLY